MVATLLHVHRRMGRTLPVTNICYWRNEARQSRRSTVLVRLCKISPNSPTGSDAQATIGAMDYFQSRREMCRPHSALLKICIAKEAY